MTSARREDRELIRPGLLPAVIGAASALIGIGLLGSDQYLIIRFLLSILALIIAVFAWQGRKRLWLVPLAAIAVLWNPVIPFEFAGAGWMAAHVAAAGTFLAVGMFLRVRDHGPRRRG